MISNSTTPMLATLGHGTAVGPVLGLLLTALSLSASVCAQGPSLGTAAGFAVLAGSTVTNAGASVITGNVGVAPGTAITGFPPGTVTGSVFPGGAVATQAQVDATAANAALTALACGTLLTGQNLGGMTLTPGVYCYAAAAQLTGTLTLDGLGNATSVFVIRTGSTLISSVGSAVHLVNGANANNVFWQVGSSATIGATNAFVGTLIAQASISLGSGASLHGRAIARTAGVTLDTDSVVLPSGLSYGAGCGSPLPLALTCTVPALGTNWYLTTTNIDPVSPIAVTFLGVAQTAVPLDVLGAPGCIAYVGSIVGSGFAQPNLGGTSLLTVPVPANPGLVGFSLNGQSICLTLGNPLNIYTSNGVTGTVGL
jgi:hypothetical protein